MSEPQSPASARHAVSIPTTWTAEQAVTVVDFLDTLLSVIWELHGDAMAEVIAEQSRRLIAEQEYEACAAAQPDDDVPF
jgi:hypothetical protein